MKILLKAVRSSKDLTCLFNYCENNGIEMLREGRAMTLENIQTGVINWGGYGSNFSFGPNLFNYFTLEYPDGDPARGNTFAHVKMLFNGDLKNNDTEEVIKRIEKLGGLVVQDIDSKVNLIVNGKNVDKQLQKKAEKLNHVLILDEKHFIEILPAIRKKPIKQKVKPKKNLPSTVDKKVLDNLKKLFISRDNNLIFQGLEMFRSLENAAVSKYFLDGVKYSSKSDGRLIPNSIFSGTGPAQSYLNYALLGVIAYAPNDCEIANNFKSSIKFLNIETNISRPLLAFKNLESLNLSDSEELEELDGIASLKKLENIEINNCKALKSLKGLLNKNLKTTSLDLEYFQHLESLEGVQSMNKLEKIVLTGCDNLKNVDALKNLTQLKEVKMDSLRALESLEGFKALEKISTELDLYGFDSIKNLKGIQNFHKLQTLRISCDSVTDISSLKGLKSLKDLDINCNKLNNLKGIESLPKLEKIDVYAGIIKSLDGLKDLPALNNMVINCDKLNNLKGLEQAPNITNLKICSKDLEDTSKIRSLTKLKTLSLDGCSSIQKLQGLEKLDFLEEIDLSGCSKLISLQGTPNPNVFGTVSSYSRKENPGLEVNFSNCSSLKDITALKGISKIESLSFSGCPSISKTEGLESIEIEDLSCHDCNINILQSLNNLKVKTLYLYLDKSMTSLEGLKAWKSVTNLNIDSNSSYDEKNENFKSLAGIDIFSNINFLGLENCKKIKNLIGIEKLEHLEKINLTGCSALKEVNSLSELSNLEELKMDGCTQVDHLPRPKVMEDREKVKKYQLKLLKALGKDIPIAKTKKSKTSKDSKPSVDKKTFSKITKLLTTRDVNLIDQGLELVRSLDNESLYQKLLKGIEYKVFKSKTWSGEEQEEGRLVANSTFTGSGPAQPYLNYAMRGLINNAPNDFVQKLRSEVKELKIDFFGDISNFVNLERLDMSYNGAGKQTISYLKEFSVFEKLTSLSIHGEFIHTDQDLKGFLNLKGLTHLKLSISLLSSGKNALPLKTLVGMENCSELQELSIDGCAKLIDVEGINGCQKLKSIELSEAKRLENLNGLKGLKSLKTININDAEALDNLDGLKGCDSLEEIKIDGSNYSGNKKIKQPIKNVDGLIGLKKLKDLNLSSFNSLKNVDGLKGCSDLSYLNISSDSLENINGLKNLKALRGIQLDTIKLNNIDGLSGCENLDDFNIQSKDIKNLNGLKGCDKLQELNIPSSAKSLNLDGLASMNSLRVVNFRDCEIKSFDFTQKIPPITYADIKSSNQIKSLEGIGNLINLEKIIIKDCTNLENLKGIENIKTLESVIIQDCKSLKDVKALLSLPKLKVFKMRSCGIKKEELPGHLKVIVETTISHMDEDSYSFRDKK